MGRKVLVVDDEPNVVKLVENRLKANNYEVIHAFDGEEAIRKAREENPDLILLDIMMPKMSGCEAAMVIQDDPRTKDIPIIMLTALVSKDEEEKRVKFKLNLCMAKPFDYKILLQKVEEHIRK
jgi:CheY-like chemotaxis protein